MTSQFIITVDVGTSSTKTSLWTDAGELVAHASSTYSLHHAEPLWAEIDGDIWWQAVCETIKSVLAKSGVDPVSIAFLMPVSPPRNGPSALPKTRTATSARRLPSAHLPARDFAVDALRCTGCAGATRVLAAIQSPDAIRAILECLGLPARPPPAPATVLYADSRRGQRRSEPAPSGTVADRHAPVGHLVRATS